MGTVLNKDAIKRAVSQLQFDTDAFIDGQFVKPAGGKTFATENPATGKELAQIAECEATDVDRAVAAAKKAFDSGRWSRMAPGSRKKILQKFCDRMAEHELELALLDCLEAGKPVRDCIQIDAPETIECIRWHAEAADKLYDHVSPTGPENLGIIVREPVGVVGAVIPWNFPAQMAAWKIGPILATGNSLILKPAEQTSLSAILMAKLAAEAGMPEGVFNVVPGFGETAGRAIGMHMDVDMVAFTGSTEVGRYFLEYAAKSNLKKIILECGGKSPQVVMEDADLDLVAENAVNAAFWNMGENCSCGSRLIVQKNVKDTLVKKIADIVSRWKTGDPLDPENHLGSMIEKPHMEKVLGYIEAGKNEGAKIVLGGKQILKESGGCFVEPTIFDGVTNSMKIAREEIFGPVLSVITFEDEAQAVSIANDTPYGLAASVYTQNLNAAHRIAKALRAGTVSVNCFSEGDLGTPFGGYKHSGFFGRDKSIFAHEQYTEMKTVWFNLG